MEQAVLSSCANKVLNSAAPPVLYRRHGCLDLECPNAAADQQRDVSLRGFLPLGNWPTIGNQIRADHTHIGLLKKGFEKPVDIAFKELPAFASNLFDQCPVSKNRLGHQIMK